MHVVTSCVLRVAVQNNRRPSHLSVHALHEGEEKSLARSCQWSTYDSEAQLMEKAYSLLISNSRQRPGSLGPESEKRGPSPWYVLLCLTSSFYVRISLFSLSLKEESCSLLFSHLFNWIELANFSHSCSLCTHWSRPKMILGDAVV